MHLQLRSKPLLVTSYAIFELCSGLPLTLSSMLQSLCTVCTLHVTCAYTHVGQRGDDCIKQVVVPSACGIGFDTLAQLKAPLLVRKEPDKHQCTYIAEVRSVRQQRQIAAHCSPSAVHAKLQHIDLLLQAPKPLPAVPWPLTSWTLHALLVLSGCTGAHQWPRVACSLPLLAAARLTPALSLQLAVRRVRVWLLGWTQAQGQCPKASGRTT